MHATGCRTSSCKGAIRTGCALFLTVFLTLVFVTSWILIRKYLRDGMNALLSPQEIAEMDEFFTVPIEIPNEWQEVDPFPPDLLEAAEKLKTELLALPDEKEVLALAEEMKESGDYGAYNDAGQPMYGDDETSHDFLLQTSRSITLSDILGIRNPENPDLYPFSVLYGGQMSRADWDFAEGRLRDLHPVLDAAKDLVEHVSYEMEAFPVLDPPALPDVAFADPDAFTLFRLSKLSCLEAHLLARKGAWSEAIESNLLAMRMARRHPATPKGTRLHAPDIMRDAGSSLRMLTSRTENSGVLLTALTSLNQMDPWLNPDVAVHTFLVDTIGNIRRRIRSGEKIDLSRKIPGGDYFREELERTVGPIPPAGLLSRLRWHALGLVVNMDDWFPRTMLSISAGNAIEVATSENVAEASFDLLRLEIANRIVLLESGRKTDRSAEFVPRFFEEELLDPFTTKPYLWEASNEVFYSMGPDRNDDGNLVAYDSLTRKGDISLIPREDKKADSSFLDAFGGMGGVDEFMQQFDTPEEAEEAVRAMVLEASEENSYAPSLVVCHILI